MVKRSVPTRKDNGEASGQPQGRKHASTVGLALHRRDALAILVTGLLLALLVLSGVASGEPRVAQPTNVAGSATAPHGRCDPDTPCATAIAVAARVTTDRPLGVDARIAHVLCDLNSPCAPDLIAAWNRLCDLNTPCLPGEAANGSAPGQQGVVQLHPAADTSGLAQWDTFDFERWVQARLYAIEVRDNGAGTTDGDGGPCRVPGRSCDR